MVFSELYYIYDTYYSLPLWCTLLLKIEEINQLTEQQKIWVSGHIFVMCKLYIFIYTEINPIMILNEKSMAISSNILYIDINFIKKEFDFGMIFDKYIFSIPRNLFGMTY